MIGDLKSKGLVKESEGAQVMFIRYFMIPLMLVKSDGGFTYDTTDMAALWYRLNEEKAEWIIYVTEAAQQGHFDMLFQAARKAGWLPSDVKTYPRASHASFGKVLRGGDKRFRSRFTHSAPLVDLLYEAKDRSKTVLIKHGYDKKLTPEELDQTAEAVGYGALKYADLKNNRLTSYTFGYDQMLSEKGDTAVYLLKVYGRICSIIRKCGKDINVLKKTGKLALDHADERALGLHLLQFAEAVEEACTKLLPNVVCMYLYRLSKQYTKFYSNCRVIGSAEETVESFFPERANRPARREKFVANRPEREMEVVEKRELKLYNSKTETTEVFNPIDHDNIGMSICVTSTGLRHLGNARSAVNSDLLYRYLRHLGYQVTCVQKFNKVEEEANEQYIADIGDLQCLTPTHQLGSSENMIENVSFDIHGCGHHNAIPQCVACDASGANYLFLNGNPIIEDMGQPLENFLTREIIAKYHPVALRHFFTRTHYRSPLLYSVPELERSSEALDTVYQTLQGLYQAVSPHREDAMLRRKDTISEDGADAKQSARTIRMIQNVKRKFEHEMPEDLKTSHILRGDFQETMRMINNSVLKLKTFQNERRLSLAVSLVEVEEAVTEVLGVLGLHTTTSYREFLEQLKRNALARDKLAKQEVLQSNIQLDAIQGTVVRRLAGDSRSAAELMEFVTPAGNFLKCVRKTCGNVESEARREFEILCLLKGSARVVQCFGDLLHQRQTTLGVTVYGFYMEYASSGTLEAKIEAHPKGFPTSMVVRFARMILLGLRSLHEVGYVHGDLHSGNVLLFPCEGEGFEEEAKICDVGNAKKIGGDLENRKGGAALFMSPESLSDGTYGTAHDIWSVGIIVVHMFTKRKSPKTVYKKEKDKLRKKVEPIIPPNLGDEATDFLKLCLAGEPEDRGTISELLDHAFLN
ncbi:hypothetical protein AALP_AA1G330800 [Arabis alpina]|uniref:arginine--tRNA ligase n=1 Tax=Arabis alpina TaxID=50452 RepID=A0A087HS96_ARAAL|nr:hypothetical protein AALP_AA1G330800 [Arabis alpina]